jgi:hypothetical protein
MRRTRTLPLAIVAAALLSGCDAWDRFVERFVFLLALFFASLLVPIAVGAAGALYTGLGKPATVVDVVFAWLFAAGSGFFAGLSGQFAGPFRKHAIWAVPLPLLALPAAAWALVHSAKLARQRGVPSWFEWVLGAVGVGYAGWIVYLVVHGFGLI